MTREIAWEQYLDRVFGCWLGKCVAGTIGAPYEGMKQLLGIPFRPELLEKVLPNDDLDLQVLWLSVLEERGTAFTADDLAEAFATRCPYAPGEYAVFMKNHARGLRPPLTGSFNNHYYREGMGCPIRSEIWACIAPGDPALAADCASKDGILDHAGESVHAERFLAAAEALAFVDPDLDRCLDGAMAYIAGDSRIARLIADARAWCREETDWRVARERILAEYGHPDCTNLFQNIGITLLALHYGRGDLIETTMIALNCGFDTDCTCATAGAFLGILQGARALVERHGVRDHGYKLDVDAPRRSDRLLDLAEDTCRMGLVFAPRNAAVRIVGGPEVTPPAVEQPTVEIAIDYGGAPAIGLGESRTLSFLLHNYATASIAGRVRLRGPSDWRFTTQAADLVLAPGHTTAWAVGVTVPADVDALAEANRLAVEFAPVEGDPVRESFGLVGAQLWRVWGPYWANRVEVPPLGPDETYWAAVTAGAADENDTLDRVRDYHVSAFVQEDREHLPMVTLPCVPGGKLVSLPEDRFTVSDLFGWQGPCVAYLTRRLLCPEERTMCLQIGHSDAFELWLNGDKLVERTETLWWTNENVHLVNVPFRAGENVLALRLVRRGAEAQFSLAFSRGGTCTHHYADLGSARP